MPLEQGLRAFVATLRLYANSNALQDTRCDFGYRAPISGTYSQILFEVGIGIICMDYVSIFQRW